MNENPPSSPEGGPAHPANDVPAAREAASADPGPAYANDPALHSTGTATSAAEAAADEQAESALPFPWPPGEGESFIAAGGRTWRDVMLAPASFYRRMPTGAPLGGAIVYFLVITVLAGGIQLFWDMVGLLVLPRPAEGSAWTMVLPTTPAEALISFFFSPVMLLAFLFIGSAVTHGLLKLIGGAGQRYGTTVSVFAYGHSPHLLVIFPFIGAFLAMVYGATISIIGLREAHRTTTMKAALAILLPFFGIFFLLMMLLVVAAFAAALLT